MDFYGILLRELIRAAMVKKWETYRLRGMFMAKPIRPTPTFRRKDALHFAREMLSEQANPSQAGISTTTRALKNFSYFEEQIGSIILSEYTD